MAAWQGKETTAWNGWCAVHWPCDLLQATQGPFKGNKGNNDDDGNSFHDARPSNLIAICEYK